MKVIQSFLEGMSNVVIQETPDNPRSPFRYSVEYSG